MSKHFIQAAIDTGQYFITATSMRNISIEVADVRGQFTAIAIYAAAWSPTVRVGWGVQKAGYFIKHVVPFTSYVRCSSRLVRSGLRVATTTNYVLHLAQNVLNRPC